ncbi:MAG: hypothetical protein J5636_11310 [Clostridiales bacterium]|nr:hypothetical protein [Clostridiales bacterium]
MKQMKAMAAVLALTVSVALGASGCTLEIDGDEKQIESLVSGIADTYLNGSEKQNGSQPVVTDEDGNVISPQDDGSGKNVLSGNRSSAETNNGTATANAGGQAGKSVDAGSGNSGKANSSDQAPAATQDPAKADDQAPAASGNQAPAQGVNQAPAQSETQAPAATQEQAPAESSETAPAERQVEQPQESQAPAEDANADDVYEYEEDAYDEDTYESETSYSDPSLCQYGYITLDTLNDYYYRTILQQYDGNYKVRASFMHLNTDDIPELIISDMSEVDDGYYLSIYTYLDGEPCPVLEQLYCDSSDYFTYIPYSNRIAELRTENHMDFIAREFTLYDMIVGDAGPWGETTASTPYHEIRGYVNCNRALYYLRNCYLPTDDDFIGMQFGYTPEYREISDYSLYNGRYSINEGSIELFLLADEDGENIEVYLWFYRTAELDPVILPLNQNVTNFWYHGWDDRNYNGQVDPGETFYRKATIELQEYGVQLLIEELDGPRELETDVSEYFGGGVYIRENTYFFSLQHKT